MSFGFGNGFPHLLVKYAGLDVAAQDLLDAMSVAPSPARAQLINQTIRDLKGAGIWDKLDCLWLMAAHDQQAANLNWRNPNSNTLVPVNSPTFDSSGYSGNGINTYLRTNTILSTLTNYQLNNNSVMLRYSNYVMPVGNEAKAWGGVYDGSYYTGHLKGSGETTDLRNNSIVSTVYVLNPPQNSGIMYNSRYNDSTIEARINGVITNGSYSSDGIPSAEYYLLSRNLTGGAGLYIQSSIESYSISSYLNENKKQALDSIIEYYISSVL